MHLHAFSQDLHEIVSFKQHILERSRRRPELGRATFWQLERPIGVERWSEVSGDGVEWVAGALLTCCRRCIRRRAPRQSQFETPTRVAVQRRSEHYADDSEQRHHTALAELG